MVIMEVISPESLQEFREEVIAAIGVFDGVHLGHKKLFEMSLELRSLTGRKVMAVTFHPHPRSVVAGNNSALLSPQDERVELVRVLGVDYYVSLPFTRELSLMSPEAFAELFLKRKMNASHVVCGFNFTFGYAGRGSADDLEKLGGRLGFTVHVVPPQSVAGEVVSSTRIRALLQEGEAGKACECLGRPYCIYGKVIAGDGRGRKLGFPTSNVELREDKLMPAPGVYAGFARVEGDPEYRTAVVNLGYRPTFGGQDLRCEVHLPGVSANLYGKKMAVFFVERLRDEMAFSDTAKLVEAVQRDIQRAERLIDLAALRLMPSFTLLSAYDRIVQRDLP